MKTRENLIASALLAILGVSTGAALAAADPADAPMHVVRSVHDGRAYQNGGVGQDEVRAMDAHMKIYNLRMTFSEGRQNAFATGVQLKIVDAVSGKPVFQLGDAGPMTDVALPPGQYKVQARFGAVERRDTVEVAAHGEPATVNLHWQKDES
jgi:hypothetical protein